MKDTRLAGHRLEGRLEHVRYCTSFFRLQYSCISSRHSFVKSSNHIVYRSSGLQIVGQSSCDFIVRTSAYPQTRKEVEGSTRREEQNFLGDPALLRPSLGVLPSCYFFGKIVTLYSRKHQTAYVGHTCNMYREQRKVKGNILVFGNAK